MATAPTPTPEIRVHWPVKCPSCGSMYNGETRELVSDTKLSEKISQLETELTTLRGANAGLVRELEAANAKITELSAPAPAPEPEPEPRRKRGRDFVIGGS